MNKKIAVLSLLVTALGYSNDEFFYEEASKGVKLNESVISTTGFETAQRNVTNTVTVITAKDIEEKNYQSVSDALRDVPSVNIIGDPKDPIIDMRGQGTKAAENVQVLIDGISTGSLDSSHGRMPINTVPVENIEKIEVIPGGGAILYGSGTRGGVINIITKSGAGYKGGSVSSEFTSFGTKKGDVSFGTTVGDFGVGINYTKNDYKGFRDGDESDSEFFEGSLKYKIDENQNITLKYSRYDENATSPERLTKEQLSDPTQSGLTSSKDLAMLDVIKDEFNLKYENKINDNLKLDILSFYQESDIETVGTKGSGRIELEDKKVGFKPKLQLKYGENNEIVFGYDFISQEMNRVTGSSTNYNLSDFTKMTNSGFVLNRNRFGKIEFTQGFRYERADYDLKRKDNTRNLDEKITKENYAAEATVNYLYSDTGNVYAKIERGFRSPLPPEMANTKDYSLSKADSETYLTYELGAKDYILGSYVNGAVYYTETDNEIARVAIPGTFYFDYYNIGKTKRYGAELSAEQYFGKLTVRESYALIKTEILESANSKLEGKEISDVPTNKLSLGLSYEVTPKFTVLTETVYTSAYYINDENTGGKQNENIVTNVTFNYNPTETLKLYTGVRNLFNEKYYNSIKSDGKYFDPAAERSFYAGFKYNF
ncbi:MULTISPECIES: TonB-dependent receptor [unclassified Cetobacterium]|uniref:TonB-dependent receptor family protein n=1 Tax=unclassified Cetobacterium TaxID=2630983 RepID=UPI0006461ECC|nr:MULTISPECIES: TonB-dependent receptor [unclassified Cetobacterium]